MSTVTVAALSTVSSSSDASKVPRWMTWSEYSIPAVL
jgi:hypothetical protein